MIPCDWNFRDEVQFGGDNVDGLGKYHISTAVQYEQAFIEARYMDFHAGGKGSIPGRPRSKECFFLCLLYADGHGALPTYHTRADPISKGV